MAERILGFFRDSITLMSFFSIFLAGMIVTLFSLIFGGDHDHGGDAGHDVHGDSGDSDGEHQGPGMFSLRGISLLATGFGAVSFLVMYYTNQILVASVAGMAFGWVFAFVCLSLLRIFIRQQGSSLIDPKDFVGVIGEVTTGIPPHGVGEVRVTVDGVTMTRTASAVGGKKIPTGRVVRVIRAEGGTVCVEEASA